MCVCECISVCVCVCVCVCVMHSSMLTFHVSFGVEVSNSVVDHHLNL